MATTLILLVAILACWFIARIMKSFKTFVIAVIAILLGFTIGAVYSNAKPSKNGNVKECVISKVSEPITLNQAPFVIGEDFRLQKPMSKSIIHNRSNMIIDSNIIRQLLVVLENPMVRNPEWFNDS